MSASQQIEWIDDNQSEMIEFLSEYVSYRSATENEAEVQREFLKPFFEEEMAWDVVREVDVSEAGDRPNLNIRWKGTSDDGEKNLLFNGHSDVVDVDEEEATQDWTYDPWDTTVTDGRIYGRGTNDMKGPNTATIWAAKALMETGVELEGDLVLSLVVGEEFGQGRNYGAKPATQALLDRGVNIPLCINVEGTSGEIHTKTSFLFDFRIEIPGKKIHASQRNLTKYPQRYGLSMGSTIGVDAGLLMAKIRQRLDELEDDWNRKFRDRIWGGGGYPTPVDEQGVGAISLACTEIEAGDYSAAIPGHATIKGQVYGPPFVDQEQIWEELTSAVDSVSATHSWLSDNPPKYYWKEMHDWPPVSTSIDSPASKTLGEAVKAVTGEEPIYSGSKILTDASFIQECGVDVIVHGPGNLAMGAHGPDEFLGLDDMVTAAKVYVTMMKKWCT